MMDEYQLSLVQRVQSGDPAAEEELFEKYKDPIFWKICRHIKTGVEQRKDVAGEVYLAVLEGIRKESFRPERWASLDAFIWGVTNNKIRDWFKKSHSPVEDPLSEELPEQDEDERNNVENQELNEIIRLLIKRLAPKYKEVVDLRYYRELSVAEISRKLGIEPRRVSERINYALKLLRKECKKRKISSIFSLVFLFFFWDRCLLSWEC